MSLKMVFTVSTINPFTGKRLREWRDPEGRLNGFVRELYTDAAANKNRFQASHCHYCDKCRAAGLRINQSQHTITGYGATPAAAYRDCVKELDLFLNTHPSECGKI